MTELRPDDDLITASPLDQLILDDADVSPREVAAYIASEEPDPAYPENPQAEKFNYAVSELAHIQTELDDDDRAKRPYNESTVRHAEVLREAIDPNVPEPLAKAENQDTEKRDREFLFARDTLTNDLNKFYEMTIPDRIPQDDERHAKWQENLAKRMDRMRSILAEFPDLSPMLTERQRKLNDAAEKAEKDAEAARNKHHEARLNHMDYDDPSEDVGSVAAVKRATDRHNAASAAREAQRVSETTQEQYRIVDTLMGELNLDVGAGRDPHDTYRAEYERNTTIQTEIAAVDQKLLEWHTKEDPALEVGVFAASEKLNQRIADLDSELANLSPRHSKYNILREQRDTIFTAIIRTRYMKEANRIEAGNVMPNSAYLRGRRPAVFRADKGIQTANAVIYADGTARYITTSGISERFNAQGEKYAAPSYNLQELPPVTDNPYDAERPDGLLDKWSTDVTNIVSLRGMRRARHQERVSKGEFIHDSRTLDQLGQDVESAELQWFANQSNPHAINQFRRTAHIALQRLEERKLELAKTDPTSPEVDDVEITIKRTLYYKRLAELGHTASPDKLGPDGSMIIRAELNNVPGEQAWLIRRDGSTVRMTRRPDGKVVKGDAYTSAGRLVARP